MRVNETSAQKRIWALVLTVMMVIGLLPFNVVAADEVVTAEEPAEGQGSALYGKVTALTGEEYNIVGEVDIEGDETKSVTVTMTKMKLKRVLEDAAIGRPVDGWWAGIRVDAPDEITDDTMAGGAQYKANGGEFQDFLTFQDGAKNGDYWIGMWNLVNEEKLNACRADGTNLTTTYEFDWNGDEIIDQTITVEIVPAYIVLLDEKGENPVYPNYCSVCGEDGVVGAYLYTIDATCVDDGFKIYECDHTVSGEESGSEPVDCDGFIVVRIPATGKHTRGDTRYGITLPTCTESGHNTHWLCEVCGCYVDEEGRELTAEQVIIPALGHYYVKEETLPTCTEEGYITYTCLRCEDSYTEPSGETATGHKFNEKVPGVAATCREEGYGEYNICSVCGAEDPENPKVTIPKLDHNLKHVKYKEPTCEAEGYNIFKCDEPTCVYGQDKNGFREIIPKLGHDLVDVAGKDATCTEAGYTAYKSCTRCEHTEGYTPLNALGHKDVSQDKDATCTEDGVKEAVVCERCGVVLHEGEVISATGHDFVGCKTVDGSEPTCTEDGVVAHKICNTCGKAFAVDADESETAALESTVVPALGHDMKLWGTQAATCTASGLAVYVCDREDCKHTTSETLAATGHSFAFVEEVPADCTNPGVEAHNECTACGKLFAADADASDITIEPLTEEELAIDALGHVPSVPVEAVNPTYDSAGNTAGAKCERCGDMVEGEILDELEEAVKFHYVISGVNGAEAAVNSGYVTLEIYFDVLADADDKEEYNSDVLANIFGIDLTMNYNKEVFELTNVQVAPGAFAKAEFTPYATANENGAFTIAQDMVNTSKVFRGENNLFATLTFQVNVEAAKRDYAFTLDETEGITVAHPEGETVGTSASDETVVITVRTLGDANGDGLYNVADSLMLSDYIRNPDIEKAYIPEYDMDKDGNIDFIDLDLLRKAIVGNNEYLTILVDPNEVAAEV